MPGRGHQHHPGQVRRPVSAAQPRALPRTKDTVMDPSENRPPDTRFDGPPEPAATTMQLPRQQPRTLPAPAYPPPVYLPHHGCHRVYSARARHRGLQMLVVIVLGVAAVMAISALTARGVTLNSSDGANPAAADVHLTACGLNPAHGSYQATYRVTNHTDNIHGYLIMTAFEAPDRAIEYGTGEVAINTLAAHESVTVTSDSWLRARPGAAVFQCWVTSIYRE